MLLPGQDHRADASAGRVETQDAVEYVVQVEEHDGHVTPRATVEVRVKAGTATLAAVEVE